MKKTSISVITAVLCGIFCVPSVSSANGEIERFRERHPVRGSFEIDEFSDTSETIDTIGNALSALRNSSKLSALVSPDTQKEKSAESQLTATQKAERRLLKALPRILNRAGLTQIHDGSVFVNAATLVTPQVRKLLDKGVSAVDLHIGDGVSAAHTAEVIFAKDQTLVGHLSANAYRYANHQEYLASFFASDFLDADAHSYEAHGYRWVQAAPEKGQKGNELMFRLHGHRTDTGTHQAHAEVTFLNHGKGEPIALSIRFPTQPKVKATKPHPHTTGAKLWVSVGSREIIKAAPLDHAFLSGSKPDKRLFRTLSSARPH